MKRGAMMILKNSKQVNQKELNDNFKLYQDVFTDLMNSDKSYIGWVDNPYYNTNKLDTIHSKVTEIRKLAQTMIVIGIGGSYLGTKAISEALENNILANEYRLIFMGHNVSSDYLNEVLTYAKNNDVVVNVISKSGTTLEPSLSFALIKEVLIKKYGLDEAYQRIIITTDQTKGTLREFANKNNILSFEVPESMGGRYSVFSPVGLIPLSFIGIDIYQLIKGAKKAKEDCFTSESNKAYQYALNRYLLYKEYNKCVESFVVYSPYLVSLLEWLKQLFAESEGKQHKGLLPIGMVFSTDLHSLGQFIQDGSKILFETIISIREGSKLQLPSHVDDEALLKYKKHEFKEIEYLINKGVNKAHEQGDVPIINITLEKRDEYNIGYLMSFMMFACAYSAYFLQVNPFDQNGVEVYKKEVKSLF